MDKAFSESKNGQTESILDLSTLVPRTGFEPAHPFERCHLKAVRLPISPPRQWGAANISDYAETLKSRNASFKLVFKSVLDLR
jgi:hypothetical protein